ncbi:MAG: SRPBCC family protein [Deltaproteobacteria bacterium]|nr:SRPBCC family protein [Deltaproteobacteria bacterium]
MAKAQQSIEIKASPKDCYDIITDFGSYPSFLNEIKSVEVMKKGVNAWEVKFTIEVIKKISYTLNIAGKPGKGLNWSLISGDMMKSNDGGWVLEDLGGATKATYSVEVNLGLLVPGAVSKMLIGSNLPSMLEGFKKRIESKKKK